MIRRAMTALAAAGLFAFVPTAPALAGPGDLVCVKTQATSYHVCIG